MGKKDQPEYWKERITYAQNRDCLRQSVLLCNEETWDRMNDLHRKTLKALIRKNDSILDVGCAYGRLIDLMPKMWQGMYYGVDVSPDFIALARQNYFTRLFDCSPVDVVEVNDPFDWAICVMVRGMTIGDQGQDAWGRLEAHLKTLAKRILILEPTEVQIIESESSE